MSIGASQQLTSLLAWTFLPSFLANLLLKAFYIFFPSRRPTLPPNPSPPQIAYENGRAQSHARRARVLLIAGYLIYTLSSIYWAQGHGASQNYYSLLGISRAVVEADGASAVKSHWRRLARVYHPDKVGKQGEQFFVELRKGVDVLENEGKRWAYERFGDDVINWGKLVTNREFLMRGVQQSVAFYVFAAGSIIMIGFFRKEERQHSFWRYLALFLTLSTEFHLFFLPGPSPFFSAILPNRLTYEHVAFLRQFFISTSMSISQLSPLLFPTPPEPEGTLEEQMAARAWADAEALKPLLQKLAFLTAQAQEELRAVQQQELLPFVLIGGPEGETDEQRGKRVEKEVDDLKTKMVSTFEDLQLKSSPQTAELWTRAVHLGRQRAEKREANVVRKASDKEPTRGPSSTLSTPVKNGHRSPSAPSTATVDASKIETSVSAATLASPPSSPTLPTSKVALAPVEVFKPVASTSENASIAEKESASVKSGSEPGEKELDRAAASRLPSPPPEGDEKGRLSIEAVAA